MNAVVLGFKNAGLSRERRRGGAEARGDERPTCGAGAD